MPLDPTPGRMPSRGPHRVPDRLSAADLAERLRRAFAGIDPSAGETLGTTAHIVWQDGGDAVLLHLESVQVRLQPQTIVVSVDLEADETGRGAVIVRFVVGAAEDMAGLIASTDDVPNGHAALAARWGIVVRDVVWALLVGTIEEHAKERGLSPQALVVVDGQLRLTTTIDVPLAERFGKKPAPRVPPIVTPPPDREAPEEPRLPPTSPPRRGTPR